MKVCQLPSIHRKPCTVTLCNSTGRTALVEKDSVRLIRLDIELAPGNRRAAPRTRRRGCRKGVSGPWMRPHRDVLVPGTKVVDVGPTAHG